MDLYDEESASEALSKAIRVQEIMNVILSKTRT